MKKRTFIRIIAYLLALLITATVFCLKYYELSKTYQNEIRYTYSRSFEEMNASLNKINVALAKLPFVTSAGQISQIATDIYTEAKIAKQAFSQLPTGELAYANVNKFFSQVGNYTVFLAQKVVDGGQISEAEKENITVLSNLAKDMSSSFTEMQISIESIGYWSEMLNQSMDDTVGTDIFMQSLNVLDESIIDYPTLLYDGPYSDYISSGSSYLIENSEAIDEQTAKTIAANALDIPTQEISLDNYDNGKISAFNFVYGEGVVSVSINGGYLISFRKYNVGEEPTLTYQQAKKRAEKFISEVYNEDNFLPNYYFTDNGTCVVNFALIENGVICYTDLVKVGVDMSNGDIVFFDARGYITNHKEREINEPIHTLEEAQALIDSTLIIKSTATALIPTSGGYEKLCYEFLCKSKDDREILVYINAETLAEEDIFLVFKTNGGTLTK